MVLMVRKLTDLAEKDRRMLMNSGMHVLMIYEISSLTPHNIIFS